ncbi:MAG: hypothetical protein J6X78_04115 [Treponema sp.]|nr:hypothetical protein [Treponema sp.]
MKKLFLSILFTLVAFSAFAEMKQYISDDYTKIGVIEFTPTDDGGYAVSLSELFTLMGMKNQNTVIYTFKKYADASKFYTEHISQCDNFEAFDKFFKEIQETEKYKQAELQKFDDNGTFTLFRILDYDAPEKKIEATPDKLDPEYETLTLKQLQERCNELANKKVAVLNTKLIGDDPIDSKGNIPTVIRNMENTESFIVMIPPKLRDTFYQNKRQSLNYYGTLVVNSSYDYYILVEKITMN